MAVPICLLLPLLPSISLAVAPRAFALLALIFGLGNALIARLLPDRLRAAGLFATVLDWLGGVGIIAVLSGEPASATPAILLLLAASMAARNGTRGLFAAIGAAALVMTLLVEFELHDAAVLSGPEATVDLASWLVVLGIGGLLAWSLMLSLNAWLRTE
ncbi:MAG TPA: hypothetical protein VFI42_03490, partial [Thermomicrobiaceae bacterium]|nr:hypothetical protein [Thermomicrobiaceae bacterium]